MSDTPEQVGIGAARKQAPRVGLFVTCLVDLWRPSVGFAAARLLKYAGCELIVPDEQTCCGQPAFNAGDRVGALKLAVRVLERFEEFDYVVVPSGSCAATIKKDYPTLAASGTALAERFERLAEKTWELTSFLVEVLGTTIPAVRFDHVVTYHDSCSGLRQLGIKQQPRTLLDQVEGLTLTELPGAEHCCGFGGAFSVEFPEISAHIAADKVSDIARLAEESGVDTVLAGDMGCLMNIAGKLKREGVPVKARHVAEVLAGYGDLPAIIDGRDRR